MILAEGEDRAAPGVGDVKLQAAGFSEEGFPVFPKAKIYLCRENILPGSDDPAQQATTLGKAQPVGIKLESPCAFLFIIRQLSAACLPSCAAGIQWNNDDQDLRGVRGSWDWHCFCTLRH